MATLLVQYRLSDQAVATEFFRAHKTISHTGELLERGMLIGSAMLTVFVVGIGVWALRATHRIVRPLHTLHRALDALAAGDLGVRVQLHREDEFREVGDALNHLVEEFATILSSMHSLVDRIAALTVGEESAPPDQSTGAELQKLVSELDRTIEFFRLEPRRSIGEGDR
jgi:methyl-accepting chemotaxis protein